MKRLNIFLPEAHYDWLYEKSKELDISVAEIVRRALVDYVEDWQAEEKGPPFEDDVLHRLSMLEYMVTNLYPEKQREEILRLAEEHATEELFSDEEDDESA